MAHYGTTNILISGKAADIDAFQDWLKQVGEGDFAAFDLGGISKALWGAERHGFIEEVMVKRTKPENLCVLTVQKHDLNSFAYCEAIAQNFPQLDVRARFTPEANIGTCIDHLRSWQGGYLITSGRWVPTHLLVIPTGPRQQTITTLVPAASDPDHRLADVFMAMYGRSANATTIMENQPADSVGWFHGGIYETGNEWAARGDQVVVAQRDHVEVLEGIDWNTGVYASARQLPWSDLPVAFPGLTLARPTVDLADVFRIKDLNIPVGAEPHWMPPSGKDLAGLAGEPMRV
jgi:hypothetical protein